MHASRVDRLHLAFAVLLTLGAAAAFYGPALRATHGDWPAPLDDVFIHYDFARSTAQGHPFEWIAGQGYSSGETAPLYPFVLAVGYLIGFRGLWLGAWAAWIACASLVVMMRGLRTLMAPAREWVTWVASAFVVGIGMLDWTWFSGMETALLGALLVSALVATKRAGEATPDRRARAQWTLGAWGGALVLVRPEAALVVFAMAIATARGARSQSALGALTRTLLPASLALGTLLGANRYLTGDAQSAGALLKLLSANPFRSDIDRARELALNLAYVRWKLLEAGLSARPSLWPLLPSLAVIGLLARRTRRLAGVCLASALAWTLIVSWNGAARFQNFRYYMPPLVLVLVASALGLAAIAQRRRLGALVGGTIALGGLAAAAPRLAPQIDFFREASANVHDQQVEVGRRLARAMPKDASVLVGDAGAIAYVSTRHAVDALGLGGYKGMPFVRAAPLGEAATVELIERMAPAERPAYLALYPTWFGAITSTFGREIDEVSLLHNVICGGVTKGIYLADWSALGDADDAPQVRGAPGRGDRVDSIDVADVVSEEEHGYVSPAPEGGWTLLDVRTDESGARRFDAGRVIPQGQSERFVVRHGTRGPATLDVRTDGEDCEVLVATTHADGTIERATLDRGEGPTAGRWALRRASLEGGLHERDAITLTVRRGTLRDFHMWIASQTTADASRAARQPARTPP